MPFPAAEYAKLQKTGTAVVRGQAFLKTRGGDVKTAAGNEVLLNPVTSYSDEWYAAYFVKKQQLVDPDPRLFDYVRKQLADGDGRFVFREVPAGEYYLTATVSWEAPVGYNGHLRPQGGVISKRISVKEGESAEIVLTR
jgi:hypothetical protein